MNVGAVREPPPACTLKREQRTYLPLSHYWERGLGGEGGGWGARKAATSVPRSRLNYTGFIRYGNTN